MIRYARNAIGVALALGVVLGLPLASSIDEVRAELITLRDGRPLHGKILSATEDQVHMELFGGGELTVPWDKVIERDTLRLQTKLGFIAEAEAEITIPGIRIELVDGSIFEGARLDSRRSGVITIKTVSGPRDIPESRISSVEEVELAARDAYTPRQLYRLKLGEGEPQTAEEHFAMSAYCQRIGDYEKAMEHLDTLAGSFPDFKAEGVRLQKQAVEVILSQQEAVNLFDEVRQSAHRKMYDKALAALTRLEAEYPDSPILEKVARYRLGREQLEAAQGELQRERVTSRYFYWMREVATRKVRDKDLTLADVKSYAQRELADDIAQEVADSEGFELDEVKELWAARETFLKRRASYASGTFLIEKPKKKQKGKLTPAQQRRQRESRLRNARSRQQQGPVIERKPPTPDEWWASASPSVRRDWLLAYYAEHSSDVTIKRIDYKPCTRCAGRGELVFINTASGSQSAICDRCWHVGRDKIVVFH